MSGNNTQFQKAEIRVLRGKNKSEGNEPYLECGFNPPEYDVSRQVNYGELEATASGASSQQFISRSAETLSMDLFFDTSESRSDVTLQTDRLDTLLTVDETLGAPPFCRFVWGDGIAFTAVLESADKQFTLFRPDGTPVRARVNVTFRQYRPPTTQQKQEKRTPTQNTQRRTVTEGDTLWGIAGQEYGDPTRWKQIASANGIEDPRSLEPGTELTIPPESG